MILTSSLTVSNLDISYATFIAVKLPNLIISLAFRYRFKSAVATNVDVLL